MTQERSPGGEPRLAGTLRPEDRREAMADVAAGIAHGFNNALAALLPNLEAALDQAPAALRPALEDARRAALAAVDLARQLMSVVRSDPAVPGEPVDALAVVRRAAGECRDACEQRARVVVAVPEGTAWVRERPGDLELLLRELGQNARDAMGAVPDPEVRFEAELRAGPVPDLPGAGSPRHLVLRVVDNGAGMSPEVLRRIGEPLFTTKPVGRGTGLGLASAFGAVRGMGGRLSCESRLGAGTTFTALLPLDDRAAAQEGPPPPELAGRRVLLVDDDGMVRAALARQLQALGLEVATAAGGAQAMARLDVERFDALLLDLDMPGVTGLDVLLHVQRVAPDLPVLVITAAFDAERLAGAMAVLAKPVDGPALRAALLAALASGGRGG